MITATGYSKDPGLLPEGIAITFGKEMMEEQGGIKLFLTSFQSYMNNYEAGEYWMHKCTNLPTREVDVIYIIVLNRLWGKVYNGGFRKADGKKIIGFSANGCSNVIDWNHIILSGPFTHCPFKRTLGGFQGFRYTTKLF